VGVQAAIALGDEIVFEESLGLADLEHDVPVTNETLFGIASVTKAFTGTALLLALEDDRIDLDAPIQRYVPEFPEKEGGTITPRLLAGHLAGLRHYVDGERTPAFYAAHYENLKETLPLFADDPLVSPPGTEYHYSSYGFNLLAMAIQAAVGERFQDYVTERIFEPLGLTSTRFDDVRFPMKHRSERYSYYNPWDYRPNLQRPWLVPRWDYSYNTAGGNVVSTASDLVRFGQAFTRPGALLSEASLARLREPIRTDSVESKGAYGWFTNVDDAGRRYLRMTGSNAGLQAALVVYPEERLSVAVLSNTWGIGSRSAEMVVDLPLRMAAACEGW
jgi:CubicO group peptidase (beta-lactamase class C family)